MCLHRPSIVLLAALTLCIGAAPTTRPAAPDSAAARQAAALVDQVYHNDLVKARGPGSKSALARAMLRTAQDEPNPTRKYALLNKAADLAIEAGDLETVSDVADRIVGNWGVDGLTLRSAMFPRLMRYLRTPRDRTAFAGQMEDLANQAVARQRLADARDLSDLAINAAQRGSDPALAKQLAARGIEIAELKNAATEVQRWILRLKSQPADPTANLEVGRYECFFQGDWPDGLARLARGSDAALKALATKDRAASAPVARVAAADAWWNLARRQLPLPRRQIQLHAVQLYQQALPELAGLSRARVQKRIRDASPASDSAPPVANPGPAAPQVSPQPQVQVTNLTNAPEARQVIAAVLRGYPGVLEDTRHAALVAYHDGSEFTHAPGVTRPVPGSLSFGPTEATGNGFLFWNLHQLWKPGRYLIVYRLQQLGGAAGRNVCTMDCYADGDGICSHAITAAELPPGHWATIPMSMDLKESKKIEYRLYTRRKHTILLDRIYIFQLQ